MKPTIPLDPRNRAPGLWEGRTISSFLDAAALDYPDRPAVVDHDVVLSYASLRRHARDLAARLVSAGVTPGQAVLVQLPNWWETIVVYHAAAQIGAVVNPVIPIYRQRELRFIVAQAQPALIVVPHVFRGFDHFGMAAEVAGPHDIPVMVVRPEGALPPGTLAFTPGDSELGEGGHPEASDASDIALLLYTSGTTGDPKGVLHSHETLVYECRSIQRAFELTGDDHVFMASPLTHITGFLYGYIMTAMLASTSVLLDVWEPPAAVEMIEAHRCRFTVSATPFLQGLTDAYGHKSVPSSLRQFACGGADVPPELIRHATDVLGCQVSRIYGSSEFPTVSGGTARSSLRANAETDGRPFGPIEARLEDMRAGVGELLARGPECFHGYLDAELNTEAFSDDGFFRTGDLATIGDDRAITIQGRKKDIILRKGENISAREVEDLLYTHPAVADVAVVAVPHPSTGERACAVVVLEEGAELSLTAIGEHLSALGVAKQKFPEQLHLIDALPRTASGKVQKYQLRETLIRLDHEPHPAR
jgi:cyclohexanecarboxylate-CoA ligase